MPRRIRLLVPLLLAIVGCTRQSEPAAPTKPASEPAVALAPPAANPTPSMTAPKGPATLAEALAVLDLRTMPRLPNARLHIVRANQLIYSAPGDAASAEALHQKYLLDQGWTLDPPPPVLDPTGHYAYFDKLGFRVILSASNSRTTDGWVDVYLMNLGNVDARSLKQMADAKPMVSNWGNATYKTDAKPAEVVAFYRKQLSATGWHEYPVSLAASHAKEDRHLLGFAQNGVEIFLNIEGAKAAPTLVVSSVSLRDRPAETPPDKIPKAATFVEGKRIIDLNRFARLGLSEGNGSSAEFTYALEEKADPRFSVTGVEAFYRDKLKAAGWSETDASTDLDDQARLVFAKDGWLLACDIGKQGDKTVVRLENLGNVRAADIPRLPDASERTWEPANDIRYDTRTPVDKATEFYRKEFERLGWKVIDDGAHGARAIVYRQNAIEMKLDLSADGVRLRSQLIGEIVPRAASEELTLRMVDFRKWPRIKDAPATKVDSAHLEYVAPAPALEARRLHRENLREAAWRELPQRGKEKEIRFEKEGFVIELLVEPAKGEPRNGDDKSAAVTLRSRGDVDLRHLPIYDVATADPESVQEDVRQSAAAGAEEIATVLQRFGWTKTDASSPTRLEFRQRLVRLTAEFEPPKDGKSAVRFRTWGIASEKK